MKNNEDEYIIRNNFIIAVKDYYLDNTDENYYLFKIAFLMGKSYGKQVTGNEIIKHFKGK